MPYQTDYSALLDELATKHNVPKELVRAIAKQESGSSQNIQDSSKGAIGGMQVMPATGAQLGYSEQELRETPKNADAGVRYLAAMLNRYGGDQRLAVQAYNAGPGAVDKYGGNVPYSETQNYLQSVLGQGGQSDQAGSQPYLPNPTFDFKKPNLADRLNQIAGLVNVLGGTTANIIGVKRGVPGAGNSSVALGSQQLETAGKKYDLADQQQRLMQYLSDPKINKGDASLAAQYARQGQLDKAINVLENSQNQASHLARSMTLQEAGIDTQIRKTMGVEAARTAELDRKQELYDNIQNLKLEGKATQNDLLREKSVSRDLDKAGGFIEPSQRDRLQPALQKISQPLINAKGIASIADELDNVLQGIETGRIKGPVNNIERLFVSSPGLAKADLIKRILQAKTATGIMGESSRHAIQIENQLGKLLPGNTFTKEELRTMKDTFHSLANEMINEKRSQYLSIKGATVPGMQEWENRMSYSPTPQGTGGQTSGKESLEDMVKRFGGTIGAP